MLEKEFHYYIDNQEELLKDYNGKHLVIIGEEVVGSYDSFEDALFESEKKYGLGGFLIQKCSPGNEDYTQHFYTPWVSFS